MARPSDDRRNALHKRITVFLPDAAGGGAERVFITLANHLASRGHEIDLVLASAKGDYLDLVEDRVRLFDLGAARMGRAIAPLIRYLGARTPDVLLSALSHANIVALAAARLAPHRPRVIVSERTSFASVRRHQRDAKSRIVRALMRTTYGWADYVTVVAAPIVDELVTALRIPREKVVLVTNPVFSPAIGDLARERPVYRWLNEPGEPVILAVGRLAPEKGFDVLIRAFADVVGQRPARLLLLGRGPLEADLQKLAIELGVANRVLMPGFDPNPFAAMARADLFVLSSRFEGMPGALVQAMACGAPIVSTDCRTGPREILEDGRWGRLVPVDDTKALTSAILAALDDPDHPNVASRAADFSLDTAVAEIEKLIAAC